MLHGKIIPLYHDDILSEYSDVLRRTKFHFKEEDIEMILGAVKQYGIEVFPQPTGEVFIDMDDLIFYVLLCRSLSFCVNEGLVYQQN